MIRELKLPGGGVLFVETSGNENSLPATVSEGLFKDGSLPDGTRLTSSGDTASMAGELLKSQIMGLAKLATQYLKELGPKELQIEAHIKFEGEVKFIPFIAAAKGDGGLKIVMKWAS